MQKKPFPEDMLNFGQKVNENLHSKEDLVKLSKKVGVCPASLYKYISDESYPTLEIAYRISKELGFSLDDLYHKSAKDFLEQGYLTDWQVESLKNYIFFENKCGEIRNPSYPLGDVLSINSCIQYYFKDSGCSPEESLFSLLRQCINAYTYQKSISNPDQKKVISYLGDTILDIQKFFITILQKTEEFTKMLNEPEPPEPHDNGLNEPEPPEPHDDGLNEPEVDDIIQELDIDLGIDPDDIDNSSALKDFKSFMLEELEQTANEPGAIPDNPDFNPDKPQ